MRRHDLSQTSAVRRPPVVEHRDLDAEREVLHSELAILLGLVRRCDLGPDGNAHGMAPLDHALANRD